MNVLPAAPIGPAHPACRSTECCLLCDERSSVLAVFLPADPALWGAPAGRERTVLYGLCPRCYARPDVLEAAEERIFQSVAGGEA